METMERHFLSDLVCEEFGVSVGDPWPDDATIYQPNDAEQSLLYEYAESLSLQTFLRMRELPFRVEMRPNAEYMSPNGTVPFLQAGKVIIAGFQPIVDFVTRKSADSPYLAESEIADMHAMQCLVYNVLLNAEKYLCWVHEQTLKTVTIPRFSSAYSWPLNTIIPFLRKREMRYQLDKFGWLNKSFETVLRNLNECCQSLSLKLKDQKYFSNSDKPTELDALIFGHLYTLITTELPDVEIAPIVKKYHNLVAFCQRIERQYYPNKV